MLYFGFEGQENLLPFRFSRIRLGLELLEHFYLLLLQLEEELLFLSLFPGLQFPNDLHLDFLQVQFLQHSFLLGIFLRSSLGDLFFAGILANILREWPEVFQKYLDSHLSYLESLFLFGILDDVEFIVDSDVGLVGLFEGKFLHSLEGNQHSAQLDVVLVLLDVKEGKGESAVQSLQQLALDHGLFEGGKAILELEFFRVNSDQLEGRSRSEGLECKCFVGIRLDEHLAVESVVFDGNNIN